MSIRLALLETISEVQIGDGELHLHLGCQKFTTVSSKF